MAVFVRGESGEGRRALVLAEHGKKAANAISASTQVASSEQAELMPFGLAVMREDAMRAEIAASLETPSVTAFASLRKFAWALALPFLWLIVTDLGDAAHRGDGLLRAAIDALCALALVREATRPSPHRRFIVAAITVGAVGRITEALAESCRVASIPAVLAAVSVALLVLWLSRAVNHDFVAREIFDALGISLDDVLALPEEPEPRAWLVAAPIGLGGMMIYFSRASEGVRPWMQIALMCVWTAFLGWITTRVFRGYRPRPSAQTIVIGALGFLAAASLAGAAHHFFDAGAYLTRCRDAATFAKSGVKAELLREMIEHTRTRAMSRDSLGAIALAAVVMPISDEILFRGLVQRMLSQRFGGMVGLFFGALLFAIARAGANELFAYEAFAAGIAFGVVYAEGGILAAVIAHVLYSAHLLL